MFGFSQAQPPYYRYLTGPLLPSLPFDVGLV